MHGISTVCLTTYITICTTHTIVNTTNGSIPPLISFYALIYVLSYSLFTPKPEAPPSSTLFFLLRTLLGKSAITLFLFLSVVSISSLVILILVGGFCGFSF